MTLTAKWLKSAQHAVNEDPAFRKLGSVDTAMGIKVGNAAFIVTFGGFSCHEVRKVKASELRDADFVVTMTPGQWDGFLAGRRDGAGKTLVELDEIDPVVVCDTARDRLDFLRYHLSLQAFLDAGARVAA